MEHAVQLPTRFEDSTGADSIGAGEEPPRSGGPELHVEVMDATGRLSASELVRLRSSIGDAGELLGAAGEARIRLVGDLEMALAHERHMGVPGTTDVITFNLAEGQAASGEALDVDLLICVDEAERQAQRRGIDRDRELLLYAVHGLLHCLGHDDLDEASAQAMHLMEDRTLSAMGLGPIYALAERNPEN